MKRWPIRDIKFPVNWIEGGKKTPAVYKSGQDSREGSRQSDTFDLIVIGRSKFRFGGVTATPNRLFIS